MLTYCVAAVFCSNISNVPDGRKAMLHSSANWQTKQDTVGKFHNVGEHIGIDQGPLS